MALLRVIETNERCEPARTITEDLVSEYGEAVYKFCRSLTYTKEDADDLFQETYVKAFGQMAKMKENPQGFLFSTALYLWKSWKRKYARRNRLAPQEQLDDMTASSIDIEGSYVSEEIQRAVRTLVNDLPEKFRIPIVLYYTVELSVSDISSALKIPEGTVKSRLHKARSLIEKGLVKNGYEK
ncbi:MAG: RNA polymerase sigma factor [Defluviitaleaceae bacterium]|nr:RNA polymerase sigma factor [Defluviitaleaceae bacterium]